MANEIKLEEYEIDVGEIIEVGMLEEYDNGQVIEIKLDVGREPMHEFGNPSDDIRIKPAFDALDKSMEKVGWIDEIGNSLVGKLRIGGKIIHQNGRYYYLLRGYIGKERKDPFYPDTFHSERIVH